MTSVVLIVVSLKAENFLHHYEQPEKGRLVSVGAVRCRAENADGQTYEWVVDDAADAPRIGDEVVLGLVAS